ncbi:aminopeptidase N-like [Chironomus tepperi]|uniref:aminopeptidase N-like n=1 Tax=Chironomus tepperi TaxID=113505 RepID=UPI00391F850F
MVKWKISSGLIVLVTVLITVISAVPHTTFDSDVEELKDIKPFADDRRLPKNVVPVHYDLSLTTNVHNSGDRATIGFVKILVKIVDETNQIVLNSKSLTITYMRLTSKDGAIVYDADFSHDTSKDFLIITLTNTDLFLPAGNEYIIELAFSGILRTDMEGFYRSSYYVKGETLPRYLAATQFQEISAQTAFPCFDEPALKASFKLALTHASQYDAVSNTYGVRTQNPDGTTTTTFDKTPIMSSYLLAFLISDLAYRSIYNGPNNLEYRLYAREEVVENVQLTLKHSSIFLKHLQEYCNFEYELPKVYGAAVPDFAAGGMENWGLILYREPFVIVDEGSHPRELLDHIRVTAHEIAHQFFGNVVTLDWWDKQWVNEAFATLFEHMLIEFTYPYENMRGQFNIRKVQNAFRRDSLHSTEPMTIDKEKPLQINYDKGGSVVRMFKHTTTDDLFRAVLNKYLTDNNHKGVNAESFLTAFEAVIAEAGGIDGLNITRAFKTWELQKGYPMITVTFNSAAKQFEVTQKRYLSISEEKLEDDNSSWYIPLSYTTGVVPDFDQELITDFFVDGESQKNISTAGIAGFDGSQWFIFNIQQLGFYRVNYDESNWRKIIAILNSDNYEQIHVLNRAQLVDDALTFAFDGVISYDIAFGVVSYLERETNYIPWYPVSIHFDKLDYILKGTSLHNSFKRFVRKIMRRLYVINGLEDIPSDPIINKLSRDFSIDWTCRMGDENCLSYADSQLTKENPKPVELVLQCYGLKGHMKQNEFVNIYRKFQAATDQNDRLRYLDTLLCSSDPEPLSDFLETTLGTGKESLLRAHERSRIYNNILSRSSVGVEVLLNFMVRFYDEIRIMNGNVFDSWLTQASSRISSHEDEKFIFQTIDQLEAAGRTFGPNLRANIAKNIQQNRDFTSGERYRDSLLFIDNFLKAIDDEEQQLRLPQTSEPQMYRIKLNVPQIQNGGLGFTGDVSIDIMIKQTTDRIMFHSKQQTINELRVFDRFGNEIQVLDFSIQTAGDSLTIYFLDTLSAGTKITVNIKYSANLLTASTGFYRTSYVENGQTRYLATTQFQPTGARYAFPNYDEPGFKTPFELSITHDKSYSAIANTFGIDFDNGDGTVTTEFERTPVMSSYLLAFVVSEFAHITNEDTRGTRETLHRVWTKPDSISKAHYGLDNSVKALKVLENYCGFDYVLPKVDSAAIPNKNSAMENWGMVTYWETAMIYQEDFNNISHSLKLSGVTVIAHELAHQFFGDAVTCQWWSQIWLNEGFATLFERVIVDILEPTWRSHHFMNAFSIHNRAFLNDARDTTRPMTWDVNTLTEISNSFDRIAYEKSGAVLRMFLYTVGESNFKKAIQKYLKT